MVGRHPRKTSSSQSLEGPSAFPKSSLKATFYQQRSQEEPISGQSPLSSPIQPPGGCNHGRDHVNSWRHNCDTRQRVLTLHYWCPSCPRLLENAVCDPPWEPSFKVHLLTEAPDVVQLVRLTQCRQPCSSEWRLQNTAGYLWSWMKLEVVFHNKILVLNGIF